MCSLVEAYVKDQAVLEKSENVHHPVSVTGTFSSEQLLSNYKKVAVP